VATVTEYDSATTQSTSNVSTYNSGNIAPSVGQLLVVAVIASGTVDAADVTASANGVSTFTRVDRATFGPTLHSVYLFVANQLTTGTSTMQVTFDCTGDAATGAIVLVCAVNGMTKTGATAIKQSTRIDDGAGATTPVFTFGANCLTGNVTIYALGEISTAGVLTPTNWTQGAAGAYSTPTIGGAYGYRASGFTGTTVTWPGNETAHGGVFVELDTTGAVVNGAAVGSFGFTATAAGVPTTFGVAAASFGFTATGAGVDRAIGAALASFGFTGTASGVAGAPTVTGAAVAAFGFAGTANGIDRALGQAAAVFGFTGTSAGQPTTLGTALAAFGYTATTAGIDRATGNATASFGYTGTAAGLDRVLGAAATSLGFTAAASGTTSGAPVTGVAVASFGFTGASLGVDRATGVAATTFGFTATALGVDTALGTTAGAFGFTGTATGQHRVVAVAVSTFGYSGTATGRPVVLGVAVATFGFTGDAAGLSPASFRDITASATLHQPWAAAVTRRTLSAILDQPTVADVVNRTLAATIHKPWKAALDA
jgi:hypothetical protein